MEEGHLENNPVIGTKPSKEKSRDRVLSTDELRIIWNALPDDTDDDYAAIVKLLALTGQRENEIAALGCRSCG